MVFGSFVVALCLFILGWTAEIVGLFVKDPEKVFFHISSPMNFF
jgi:solute carrier family 45 protein 1/2/4